MLNTFDILREGGDDRRWDELEDFVRQKDFASAGGRDVHPAPGGNGGEGGSHPAQGAGGGVVHPAQGGEGGANLPQVEMEK